MKLRSHRPSHSGVISPAVSGARGLRVIVCLLLIFALPNSGMAGPCITNCQHFSESSSRAGHLHGAVDGAEHGAGASATTERLVDAQHAGHQHRHEQSECKCHSPCSGHCASACMLVYAMPAETQTVLHRFLPDYAIVANHYELSDAHSRKPFQTPILLLA